jgi:hypothetical protein
MSLGQYQVTEDVDYTTVYDKIAVVYGRNDNGYGQTMANNPAVDPATTNPVITATQWDTLRVYITNTRIHQAGSASLIDVSSGDVITYTQLSGYNTLADTCTTDNRIIAAGQFTPDEAKASATRQSSVSGTWGQQSASNHVLTATCTVTGANMNGDGSRRGLRYFFNAGGKIKIALSLASFTGGVSGKGQIWADLFSGAGTIYMDYTQTLCTGSGTTSTVGGLDLTTTDQQIFRKDVSGGVYSENYFIIYARFTDVNQTAILFTVKCYDLDAVIIGGGAAPAPGSTPGTPSGNTIDEAVDGNLTVSFAQDRPSGSYVSITTPTYSSVSISTGTS